MKTKSLQKALKVCLIAFLPVFSSCNENIIDNAATLLPLPNQTEHLNGGYAFRNGTVIGYADKSLEPAAQYLSGLLTKATGYEFKTAEGKGEISLTGSAEGTDGQYQLEVQNNGINITGTGYAGVISGIQTLRQLMPNAIEAGPSTGWKIANIKITDRPRYQWRGLMLDVSRHFYDKAEVEELLDLMSLYKINKFHWHLTDDQGWRIEIKRYPLLTEKGAYRHFNKHDRGCMELARKEDNPDYNIPAGKLLIAEKDTLYGGFYTQEDIREIVSYAAVRGIDIIPEIDMPGHMLAAVSNYSGLACNDNTGWGEVFSSPLCPGKDKAIEFCKNVYKEVFTLFPYKYVHIGGDEVDKTNWKKCPDCQRRIRAKGLKSEAQLQAWFNHEMEAFFNANGKEMIGWDEIEEGGLSETSTVMWWRSWAKNMDEKVTAQGNKIIYTPNTAFYLDYQQDKNSVRKIYDFTTGTAKMNDAQKALIMGVQGNIWCEWIPSRERLLYMAAPRMLAIAELGWSDAGSKDWKGFEARMVSQFDRMNTMNVNYRIPDIDGFYKSNAFVGETTVEVSCIDPNAEIRYTTDGSIPDAGSALYTGGIQVNETTDFIFRTFRKDGSKGDFVRTRFFKDTFSEAQPAEDLKPGLQAAWHEYGGNSCEGIEKAPLKGSYITEGVSIPQEARGKVGLKTRGYIYVPDDDVYTFFLTSDDGSILKINGQTVVDNDGPHAPREVIGQKALKKGCHAIEISYFDHNGGTLSMEVRNSKGVTLPAKDLYFHQ